MNATKFRELSLSNQSLFLWEQGVHLCSKKAPLFLVHLYAIKNFYVEVYFSYNLCRIERIHVLDGSAGLDTYLLDIPMPANLN
jgi:hypothetical protein